jgi:hypothetical protein
MWLRRGIHRKPDGDGCRLNPMHMIGLRRGALAGLYLVSVPFLCFAQGSNEVTAAPIEDTASAPATNAAENSLQRALARGVVAEFSHLSSVADPEPSYSNGVVFSAGQVLLAQGNPPSQTRPPATTPAAPTLGDLGFPAEQTQGNAQDQARLDKRSHMLKVHQRLGLITTIPLAATLLTSALAGGKDTSSSGRDLHAALGGLTTGLYFTTAYYSIFAPKVAGTSTRGSIRLHRALALIHGPGMILTPILGVMAYEQKSRGERVHGIASAHGAVASVTSLAYGLAILSVSFKF